MSHIQLKKSERGGTGWDYLTKRKAKKREVEQPIEDVTSKYNTLTHLQSIKASFKEYPLSNKTLNGLDECGYDDPTDIQRDSLPLTLLGHDVVAAAKTGSGKTLAMLIPILECLWRNYWSPQCGLGALIISPTRELALQTFTCLNNIGKGHDFSCALLIGGTDLKYERNRLGRVNIIICTPGRLLQHMDENEQLICDHLLVLALDEADRMLDMGFATQLNSIMDNLPRDRQTLLFSATQTKSIKDLSRVCAKDPYFVNPHLNSEISTPKGLSQSYMVVEEHQKINMLWSFIKTHTKQKTLVFVTNCKQARFLTDAFCHLRPGVVLMGLWGTMNQSKRVEVFQKFENSRRAVMIATDVASRGLDFSDIDWILQVDAPPTMEDYIHRVGRTARMDTTGSSLLFLTKEQEKSMCSLFKKYNVPIEQQKVNEDKILDARPMLQSTLAEFSELKEFAQRSIVAYIKSIYLMKNKKVFDVNSIDVEALSNAHGLLAAPKVRFLRERKRKADKEQDKKETKVPKTEEITFKIEETDTSNGADDDIFTIKQRDVFNALNDTKEEINLDEIGRKTNDPKTISKIALAKKILRKGVVSNKRVVFDEEDASNVQEMEEDVEKSGLDIEEAKVNMAAQSAKDKKTLKEKKRRIKELEKKKSGPKTASADYEFDNEESDEDPVDLDWLPDPDNPKYIKEEMEEEQIEEKVSKSPKKNKKKASRTLRDEEEMALNLLNPF